MPGLPLALMSYRFFLSSLLCVTSFFSALPVTQASPHWRVPAMVAVEQESSVSMLGLEGANEARAKDLTDALREALQARGMLGGEPLTLAEVRLMMGCESNTVACLSQAGASMGVDKLVYGSLEDEGDGHRLVLTVLDVEQATDEAQTSYPLASSDLEGAALEDKANKIVQGLFPAEATADEPPPAAPPPPQVVASTKPDKGASKYVWGAYKPRPAWKWAGLGTGLALVAAGAGMFIGTGVVLRGSLRDELLETAEASLTDTDGDGNLNTSNDIDPNDPAISDDLCAAARFEPEGQPGRVTNAAVTRVCNRGDVLETVNIAGIGVAAAGVVTTIVFTTLLFVHRRTPKRTASEARFRLTGGPWRGGGGVTAAFRF